MQQLDARVRTATADLTRIMNASTTISDTIRNIVPGGFRVDLAAYGIAAPSTAQLFDPISTSWYVNQNAFRDWIGEQFDALQRVGRRHLPANLTEIPDIWVFDVALFSLRTGVPLYRVPRRKTAQRLLKARKLSKVRRVLVDHSNTIFNDCETALQTCATGQIEYALAAIDAARGGHLHAAQALATATLDSELTYQFDSGKYQITNHNTNPDGSFDQLGPTAALTFGPIWRAHRRYWPDKHEPIPRRYNRHATIHSVSPRQFRRSNAIIALMVLTSFMCWINDNTDAEGA